MTDGLRQRIEAAIYKALHDSGFDYGEAADAVVDLLIDLAEKLAELACGVEPPTDDERAAVMGEK